MEPKYKIYLDVIDFNDQYFQAFLSRTQIIATRTGVQDNGTEEYCFIGTKTEIHDLVHDIFSNDEEEFAYLLSLMVEA